jgi:hypothetical protein
MEVLRSVFISGSASAAMLPKTLLDVKDDERGRPRSPWQLN